MAEGRLPDIRTDAVETAFEDALDLLRAGCPGAGSCQTLISAVSGGPDSMCLAVLASDYAARRGLGHRAIIIDHGLRAGSAAEAERVRQRLSGMGVRAEVQTISVAAPSTGIQEWARSVRYECLLAAARRDRAALLLGHHRDDQAETVMMRLSRGSGLAGLAAMRGASVRQTVPLLRPLLGIGRDAIARFCAAKGIAFETDPSNSDRRFERVRLRHWLAGATTVTGQTLCRLSDAASRIDDTLLAAFRRQGLLPLPQPGGHACLPAASLDLPDNSAARLVAHLIVQMTAPMHPPTRQALSGLLTRLRSGIASTLGGARFIRYQDGWLITAEDGRRPLRVPVSAGDSVIFAGTWRIACPDAGILRRLGAQGSGADAAWRECRGWADLPPLARRSVPVLETLDGTLQYPHLSSNASLRTDAREAVAEFLPSSLVDRASNAAKNDFQQAAASTISHGAVEPV